MFFDKYIKHRATNPLPKMEEKEHREEKEESFEIILRKGHGEKEEEEKEVEHIREKALELAIKAFAANGSFYGSKPTILELAANFEKFLKGEQ